jgi:predicted nucleic acid-binding protein
MLLDSTFLIDLEREIRARQIEAGLPLGPAEAFLVRHRDGKARFTVSIIAAGEFYAGAEDLEDARRFLARFRKSDVNDRIAEEAGRLDREQTARGRRLGENDNWLAATARAHKRPIVSNDRRAFAGVRRVKRVPY